MTMFSSSPENPRSSRGRDPVGDNSLSIVAPGMHIVGELTTDGVVKVEGTVEGSIRAEQQILVAKGGTVEGDLYTREAIIGGKVVGAIYADERVEVQRGSVINGDLTAQRIVVQEGGEVNGHVRMGRPADLQQAREGEEAREQQMPAREPVTPVTSSR